MAGRFTAGDPVETRFGKGVVRQVRNNRRLLIDVRGTAIEMMESELSPGAGPRRFGSSQTPVAGRSRPYRQQPEERTASAEIDLHGLTVEEALARAEQAVNEALLADLSELRFIHGRSRGRIRGALQRFLREIPSVRGFRLDPGNEGVTIVNL